jgi:hypothetical protein
LWPVDWEKHLIEREGTLGGQGRSTRERKKEHERGKEGARERDRRSTGRSKKERMSCLDWEALPAYVFDTHQHPPIGRKLSPIIPSPSPPRYLPALSRPFVLLSVVFFVAIVNVFYSDASEI